VVCGWCSDRLNLAFTATAKPPARPPADRPAGPPALRPQLQSDAGFVRLRRPATKEASHRAYEASHPAYGGRSAGGLAGRNEGSLD